MADALVSLLADTPVTVTAVRGGVVRFTCASGVAMRMPLAVFRGLFDQVPT